MVRIANSHKEVLEAIETKSLDAEKMSKDELWEKFDSFANEYNEKVELVFIWSYSDDGGVHFF